MDRLHKYLVSHLSSLFFAIFMPLFSIASVIFLIKLATFTAIIQLNILEMGKLYLFVLPEILFYTLPITFFIAATLAIFRLSNDNEIIVLFALGIKPIFIIRAFFKQALVLSIILLFNYLIIFPHIKVIAGNFISYKKSEAKFNISASEFGHSFGEWLLYLGKDNGDGSYSNVFLFNKNKKEEILISAKKARLVNDSGILRLKLNDGQGYSYSKEKFTQIDFKTMLINDTMKTTLTPYRKPLDYWRSDERAEAKRHMLITDTLLSIFPLISLFLVAAIGVVHARHQKSRIYLYLFLSIILFYSATLTLQDILYFYTIPVVALTWLLVTYLIYRKAIVARF